MHLGGNRRQVPLMDEGLSIIIYVKISRYATLRRIKRCKRVLYLVLRRTKKTRICKLKTLSNEGGLVVNIKATVFFLCLTGILNSALF